MIRDILDGISIKLNEVFGNDYNIYADNTVEQGLIEPCFFISLINSTNIKFIGDRNYRKYPFDISYFALNDGDNTELLEVGEKLYSNLDFITLTNGNMIRGSNMNYEIIDGVLHFQIEYNVFLQKQKELEYMEDVQKDIGVDT